MLTAIVSVLLTFFLTVVVGTSVVHGWQHRNWIIQRRILEAEEQYKALQKTFDEVSELSGKRQHRMFRLLSSIRHGTDETIAKRLSDYDEATVAWNERLSSLYAKLTRQLGYWLSTELEGRIQQRFVRLDVELTRFAAARLGGANMSSHDFARLSNALSVLQGRIVRFNKVALKEIESKKASLYQPKKFNALTLDSFPTWELFKALFKSRKHSLDEL